MQALVPMVRKGNEQADKLLTALTTTRIRAQTLVRDFLCSPSVTVSFNEANYRVQAEAADSKVDNIPSTQRFSAALVYRRNTYLIFQPRICVPVPQVLR